MTPSPPLEVPDEADPVELDNLYPALVECFGIILLGYVAKRFNLISDVETKGISTFTTTFALPALIFGSLIRLSLHEVNWTFLGCICLAKSLLFMVVLIVSLFSVRPFNPGKCGLYAIFTTQSNDFALGYPILVAIYGKSHPECPSYLYLMAPISLVILNPIGFIFMESSRTQSQTIPLRKKIWSVFKGIVTNAIIIMTLLGVIFNFIFEGKPPAFLNQFLSTLGAAFSATALFVLGMRMVGSCNSLSKVPWMTTLILIALKIIVLPLVAREIVSQVIQLGPSANETEHLSNFAFIYGTFPTAPSVFVFSAQYDLDQDLIAFAMVACTVVAAPIMFVSAHLLSLTEIDPNDYIEDLDKFLLDLSIVGVCVAAWVTFVLVSTKKYTRFPHFMTLVLVLSQVREKSSYILHSLVQHLLTRD